MYSIMIKYPYQLVPSLYKIPSCLCNTNLRVVLILLYLYFMFFDRKVVDFISFLSFTGMSYISFYLIFFGEFNSIIFILKEAKLDKNWLNFCLCRKKNSLTKNVSWSAWSGRAQGVNSSFYSMLLGFLSNLSQIMISW